MNSKVSVAKVIYGITFGAMIAIAYLFVRLRGTDGGLQLFCAAATLIFLGHLAIWPKLTLAGVTDSKMMVRGFLFGITQVLIFKAQATGSTTNALVAATTGNVFGAVLGRLILKEKLQGLALLAAVLCASAAFTNPGIILGSYWGLLGGFIQGLGFVLARSIMIEKKSIRQSISTGYFVAAILAMLVLQNDLGGTHLFPNLRWGDIAFTVCIGLVVQYGFFQLYKLLDSQRASLLALSRIPWAIGMESLIFGRMISPQQWMSTLLIVLGGGLFLVDARQQVKNA